MAINWNPSSPSAPVDLLARLPKARAVKAGGRTVSSFDLIAQRARAEYLEMPGLNLTRDQACCLFGLDRDLCDQLLTHLVETGFLIRTCHDTYVRADAG
jgi:hypothetical protein